MARSIRSDVVDFAAAIAQAHQGLQNGQHVFFAQDAHVVGAIQLQTHVHFHAPDRGQIITLAVEEQAFEHGLGSFHCRRFTGTHHTIDVEQSVLTGGVLVNAQGVADVGADGHVIDVQDIHVDEALGLQRE